MLFINSIKHLCNLCQLSCFFLKEEMIENEKEKVYNIQYENKLPGKEERIPC